MDVFLVCAQAAALEMGKWEGSSEMTSPPNTEFSHEGCRIKVSQFALDHFLHMVLQGRSKWLFMRE